MRYDGIGDLTEFGHHTLAIFGEGLPTLKVKNYKRGTEIRTKVTFSKFHKYLNLFNLQIIQIY